MLGAARAGAVPGLDRAVSHAARLAFRPQAGESLTARGNPAARDLVRHAFADVGGDATRARAWARAARRWPTGAQSDLLDAYRLIDVPTLLLWADEDRLHPLAIAEEALGLLPDAQLRVLPGTGFLMAYDDPVGHGARARGVLHLTQHAQEVLVRDEPQLRLVPAERAQVVEDEREVLRAARSRCGSSQPSKSEPSATCSGPIRCAM